MLDRTKTVAELEIELKKKEEIEEKIGEVAEKKEHWQSSIGGAIVAFLSFGGITSYFFIKKPEHYFYPGLIFAGFSALFLLLSFYFSYLYKKVNKELKKLERQEKELKRKIK